MSRTLSVVLAGGGTGGHVIPAIAIAEEIVRLGGRVRFIGVEDRLEARLVPEAGFGVDFIKVHPLAGGGVGRLARGLGILPRAVTEAAVLLKKTRPDAVLGAGGYVAGPVVLAAKLLRQPTALLEQNATVGLTNRILSRMVDRAFVSYEETLSAFPHRLAKVTGNPVRSTILEAAEKKKNRGAGSTVRILVMGGSQGAMAIDERVPAAMALAELGGEVSVLHQCSGGQEGRVQLNYKQAGIQAEVVPFIHDTASAYLEADLVVARAGATTVAELTVMGLPAVLIPYPHHADRQQERNADPMRRSGAAVVLTEKHADSNKLAEVIADFVRDADRRRQAAKASATLSRPNAASDIANGLAELGGDRL